MVGTTTPQRRLATLLLLVLALLVINPSVARTYSRRGNRVLRGRVRSLEGKVGKATKGTPKDADPDDGDDGDDENNGLMTDPEGTTGGTDGAVGVGGGDDDDDDTQGGSSSMNGDDDDDDDATGPGVQDGSPTTGGDDDDAGVGTPDGSSSVGGDGGLDGSSNVAGGDDDDDDSGATGDLTGTAGDDDDDADSGVSTAGGDDDDDNDDTGGTSSASGDDDDKGNGGTTDDTSTGSGDDDDGGGSIADGSSSTGGDDDDDAGGTTDGASTGSGDDDDDGGSIADGSSSTGGDDDDDAGGTTDGTSTGSGDDDDDGGGVTDGSSNTGGDDDGGNGGTTGDTSTGSGDDDDDGPSATEGTGGFDSETSGGSDENSESGSSSTGSSTGAPTTPSVEDSVATPAIPASSTSTPVETPDSMTPTTTSSPNLPNQTPEGSPEPTEFTESTVFCPDATPSAPNMAWFDYAVTLESTEYDLIDAQGAVEVLEPQLRSQMLGLLECDAPFSRKLASSFGIVGMDYVPSDEKKEEVCPGEPSLPCYVYRGHMNIYLKDDADIDIAVFETRKAVFDSMSETGLLTISKVDSITYLGPPLSDPTAVETTNSGTEDGVSRDEAGRVLSVIAALGGCFVLVAVVAAYRYRRETADKLDDPSAIDHADSQLTSMPSSESGNSAPFAGIFRFRQTDMASIMEASSESTSQAPSTSIIVSESGYSDDDSRDNSYMNSVLNDESMLGARKMDEIEPEDDYLFDNDDPMLEVSKRIDE